VEGLNRKPQTLNHKPSGLGPGAHNLTEEEEEGRGVTFPRAEQRPRSMQEVRPNHLAVHLSDSIGLSKRNHLAVHVNDSLGPSKRFPYNLHILSPVT
jgi:hypothetical protein